MKRTFIMSALFMCTLIAFAEEYDNGIIRYGLQYYDHTAIINRVLFDKINDKVFTVPNSVVYEGEKYDVTDLGTDCFQNSHNNDICTKIIVPNSITKFNKGTFRHCKNIKEIVLPDNIQYISENMFSLAQSLETLEIPEGCQAIGSQAFNHCDNLKKLIIPSSVTALGLRMFTESGVEEIAIQGNIANIPERAFARAARLKTINIPNSVRKIGVCAFADCVRLTFDTLRIPEGVLGIEEETFRNCQCISNVILPQSATYIYNKAFSGCASLKSIVLGPNMAHISYDAFAGCSNMSNIYCSAPIPPSAPTVIGNPQNITMHVPAGCLKYYKLSNWASFNIVETNEKPIMTENLKQTVQSSIKTLLTQEYIKKAGSTSIYVLEGKVDVVSGSSLGQICNNIFDKYVSNNDVMGLLEYNVELLVCANKYNDIYKSLNKELKKAANLEAQEEIMKKYGALAQ